MTTDADPPFRLEIFGMYPGCPSPERASSDLHGSLAAKAVRRCPTVTVASGFGWYVFPPVDFALRWDGSQSELSLLADNEPVRWRSLAGFHDVTLPELTAYIGTVPDRMRPGIDVFDRYGGSYPFINADTRATNLLELSTGTVVRTPPGWWLLARGVANYRRERLRRRRG